MYAHTHEISESVSSHNASDGSVIRVYATEPETDLQAGRVTWGSVIAEVYAEHIEGLSLIGGAWLPFDANTRSQKLDVAWNADVGLALLTLVLDERNNPRHELLVTKPLPRELPDEYQRRSMREHERHLDAEFTVDAFGEWHEARFDAAGLLHAVDNKGTDVFDVRRGRRRRGDGGWVALTA